MHHAYVISVSQEPCPGGVGGRVQVIESSESSETSSNVNTAGTGQI